MSWFRSLFRAWRREFSLVFSDPGVLIFFFALPTLYPVVYTLIYNPEVAREIPIVVVDHAADASSRSFVRAVNRTEAIDVIGYAADLSEAREAMNTHRCYGILEIPSDFGRRLGSGEQATVPFYADMSLLLRYRQYMFALTDVQIYEGTRIVAETLDRMGLETESPDLPLTSVESYILGDPTQGFASFIMPGILVLILQQSMILGVAMLAGGASERRRRNNGFDPLFPHQERPSAVLLGKALCYLAIYLPMLYYTLRIVPWMFSLPQIGTFFDAVLLMVPMLLASAMLGLLIGVFVTERETSFVIIVCTSVLFLFLSGLTWPRYAMPAFWKLISDCIPATWGLEAFVRQNSLGAPLNLQSRPYHMMWILALAYGLIAYGIVCYRRRRNRALESANA